MEAHKLLVLLCLLVLVAGAGMAAGTGGSEWHFNGSEPSFLKNIGPNDPRIDDPTAAAIVALGVTAALYIGFRAYRSS